MSLNLFMHELINEISDPHHPRYMPENEINIVKKFISNVFAFNPKMDTTSFVTK